MDTAVGIHSGDLTTLIFYFGIVLFIGFRCSSRLKDTEGYFVGGRKIPGWAVGISMLGTAISSVTFLAYPGSAFALNWSRLVPGLMLPIAAVAAIYLFVPFYRKARLVSAYEYLELRFGAWARTYGCVMWSVAQFYRMGIILFLLSLPIQAMTGFDLYLIIIGMGILVTIYTVVGGIEAVIWTDVLQTFVLFLGGLFCIGTVFIEVPGGASSVVSQAWANNKFDLAFSFEWNLAEDTFWVLVLNGLFLFLQEFASDQTKIQRYCAARSDRDARQAIWIGGVGCIPIWATFMFVGTCLWVYYQTFPEAVVNQMPSDQVFPYFILTQLPVGLAGFVIAAVMAAAMSSIDSSLNGSATVITADIYRRHLIKGKSDAHYLKVARIITAMAGFSMILCSLSFTGIEQDTILDIGFFIAAIFSGGLGGLFFLGFISKRTNSQGAAVGIVLTVLVTIWLTASELGWLPEAYSSRIHKFIINFFSNTVAFIIGYMASYLFPKPKLEKLTNLTWWTVQNKT